MYMAFQRVQALVIRHSGLARRGVASCWPRCHRCRSQVLVVVLSLILFVPFDLLHCAANTMGSKHSEKHVQYVPSARAT